MTSSELHPNDFKSRLLVWAARIIRTAAELENDPDKAIGLGDIARRLEQSARENLAEDIDVDLL